jgi:histidinol dehydrogenase
MTIPIYLYQNLTVRQKKKLFARSAAEYTVIKGRIAPFMEDVRLRGDQAVREISAKFGSSVNELKVSEQEFQVAYKSITPDFIQAFKVAKNNILKVCEAQQKSLLETSKVGNNGINVWREWRPLESVGIYVPGGSANYPSTLLMCATPALIAGCKKITVCSPGNNEGKLPTEILFTARELGIQNVYKIGGSQAIAAMAYGTESISPVLKIVGPGNQYVNAAKLLVYPNTAIDLPAGPSENLIIADDSANPTWVAADLITDLEHGIDSTGILLTDSMQFAAGVKAEIIRLVKTLSTASTIKSALNNYSAIIVVDSLKQALELSDEYAPEHLQIVAKKADRLASLVQNAGSVFIGPWSSKAGGDYAVGANHVLPTGQSSKMFSSLSVDSFGKWVEFQQVTERGFKRMSKTIETYAAVEGLPAHKLSSTIRAIKERL